VPTNVRSIVRACFLKHDGDGEFQSGTRVFPYSVLGCKSRSGAMILTTKPGIVSAVLHECESSNCIGMVGRYGLPDDADLVWIRNVVGRRSLYFLGDMDPVDLLVFAWLDASFRPKQVTYLGISDALLEKTKIRIPKSWTIQCSASELEAFTVVKRIVPEPHRLIGRKCMALLEQGKKLELEILLWHRRKAASTLRALLQRQR
jgi:hypothetical protein